MPTLPRLEWLTPRWPAPDCVRALSTYRGGGISEGRFAALNLAAHVEDDPAAVAENRLRLKVGAGLPGDPEWLTQVHGTTVRDLDAHEPVRPADAAVTRQPQRVAAVLTADCLPVLFATRAGDRVGAAHAGWRGLAAGVLEATVVALGCLPTELLAWLGPAIGPQRFEVGGEVRDAFLSGPGGAADEPAFIASERGRYLADLYALARNRLLRIGVRQVYGGGECTHSDATRYFSHRRDGHSGRQATLIWLAAAPRR